MAPTFKHAKNAKTTIVTGAAITGGSSINLSSGVTDVSMSRSADTSDVTTYGDGDHYFLAGLRNGTFSANGLFASTYESKIGPLLGQSTNVWIVHQPQGTAAGLPKFTAQVVVTQFDVAASVTDAVKMTMAFQRTGPLTSTTNP